MSRCRLFSKWKAKKRTWSALLARKKTRINNTSHWFRTETCIDNLKWRDNWSHAAESCTHTRVIQVARRSSALNRTAQFTTISYNTFIPQPVLLQVHSLFQCVFSTYCDLVLPLLTSSTLSVRSSSSRLHILLRLPVTNVLPSIFPSITGFRRQFLSNTWPLQLAFLLFIVSGYSSCLDKFKEKFNKWWNKIGPSQILLPVQRTTFTTDACPFPGGIRTRNPSKRAPCAVPRRRPRSYRDRSLFRIT